MDTKQPLSLFLVAILAASVFTVVGITSLPLQRASAQDVTIETSADDHDGMFFQGMLQVIIEDDSTDDDNDSIQVEITVEEDGGNTNGGQTVTIPDTNDGSQRFEFFLVHQDGADQTPADPEADTATVLDFGDAATNLTVNGFELFDSGTIEIDYGNEPTVTIDYDESAGVLTIDRDTYGSTSLVHVFIYDNDANLDPTDGGTFQALAAEIDEGADRLFELVGAVVEDDVDFDETGDNTAIFEAILQLNDTDSSTDPELVFSSETVTMQLNDKAIYTDLANGNNTSTDTSEVSFEVDDADGEIDDLGALTFGTELVIVLRDQDQNIDSEEEDDILNRIQIQVDNTGGDIETLDLTETGDNTGVFEIDLSNSELRITFLNDTLSGGGTITTLQNNGVLELRAEDIEEDITIQYTDPLDDDSNVSVTALLTVSLDLVAGSLSAPSEVGVSDEFTVTLTDQDLNDNPRTRDSYTFTMFQEGPWDLRRGGVEFGEIYTFNIEVDGDNVDFGTDNITTTITETGINTGIFEFEIDMEDITENGNNGAALSVDDGADLEVSIDDFMADTTDADEDDVTITIGKPDVGIDLSRSTLPIPPATGSVGEDAVGTTVITNMLITDPERANQTSVEESFPFNFCEGTCQPGEFFIEIEVDGGTTKTIDTLAEFQSTADASNVVSGVSLDNIMDTNTLEETGKNTGVFEAELEFVDVASMSLNDWQDFEITITYHDSDGDEESAGFTFRGNDGIVTVDQTSAKAGTVLTITVEDQDLNIDDSEVDQFESGDIDAAAGIQALLLIETEDEEIDQADIEETFEETGEDTGVFTAEFTVGDDILVSDLVDDEIEQATNILITYEDEIDSTGGSGDEVEVNVPIVSSTGSIQVTPELVGPATTLTILIIDSDLDEDANSIDEYIAPAGAEDSDDFFVSFSSDRNEVGEGSPDIEETGPNTGVFMFELELITDEDKCQDDDLDTDEFDAEGGDTDSTIGACPGDLISIRYDDELSGSGGSNTVSEVIEVQSFDPEFVADQESYSIGDRVTITISDPDGNRDSDIADSLTDIRVRSDSDQVGEELSALETGRDTGVFRLSFGTTSGTASGAISVSQGDDVTVTYTDEFPADFEEEEEDKDFQFTVTIGGGGDADTTVVTPPELTDVTGEVLDEISAGQQVVLTTQVRNTEGSPTPFVALLEVRDNNGVTVFLAWQEGELDANDTVGVGISWTPNEPGDYEVRTFVISDLNNPRVLSLVSTSDITVN